jgi:hypothetical protein
VVRIDPDFATVPWVVNILYPEATATFGRASAPCSGRLYVCEGQKSKDFRLPNSMKNDPRLPIHDGKPGLVVLQILSNGKQTMAQLSSTPNARARNVSPHPHSNPLLLTPSARVTSGEPGTSCPRRAAARGSRRRRFRPPRGLRNVTRARVRREFAKAMSTATPKTIGMVAVAAFPAPYEWRASASLAVRGAGNLRTGCGRPGS